MHTSPNPPLPPRDDAGVKPATSDMREFFAALSRQSPLDPQEERAFLKHKLELVRNHPSLSDSQKKQATDELRRRLGMSE